MAIYGYVGLPEGGPECEKIFIASLAIMTYDDLFADLRIAMTRMMTHKHFREWYTVIYSIQKKKHACVYKYIIIYIYTCIYTYYMHVDSVQSTIPVSKETRTNALTKWIVRGART